MATDSKAGEYADPKQMQNSGDSLAGGVAITYEGNTITITKQNEDAAAVDIQISTPDGHVVQRRCVWTGSGWDCS
jgi:hypothetical protein